MDPSILNIMVEGLLDFYHSDFVLWLKFFIGIYVLVLFIDIILLLILQLKKSWRTITRGANIDIPSAKKIKKEFQKIEKFLEDNNPSFWKVAVLEADQLVNKVLAGFGYKGKDMGEKLAQITPEQLENYTELQEAHSIRNQIIKEKNFELSQEEAQRIVNIYKKYLELVNLLD